MFIVFWHTSGAWVYEEGMGRTRLSHESRIDISTSSLVHLSKLFSLISIVVRGKVLQYYCY